MPFREPAEVVVRQHTDKDWEVIGPLTYLGKRDEFVVPVPMLSDFASVPRLFVWLLPRVRPVHQGRDPPRFSLEPKGRCGENELEGG